MKIKSFLSRSLWLLTALAGMQQPIMAAKHHKDSSSSSSSDCCKKTLARLSQIDQTTMQDLIIDQQTRSIVNQINQTTLADLAVDEEILDVVNEINETTQADLAVDQEILEIVTAIEECACQCVEISQQDFHDSQGVASQTYVISQPGKYCFVEDINFEALKNTDAIKIEASHVTLDFKTFFLNQSNTANVVNGVHIGRNVTDITITGAETSRGEIRNFTHFGIWVEGNTQYINISNMVITADTQAIPLREENGSGSEINRFQNRIAGIAFIDLDDTTINKISTRQSEFVDITNVVCSNRYFGINIARAKEVTISQSQFDNNWFGNWLGNVRNFVASQEPYLVNVNITNSTFDNNGPLNPGILVSPVKPEPNWISIVFGSEVNRCQNITFKNDSFSRNFHNIQPSATIRNFSTGVPYIGGVDDDGSEAIAFENCKFNENNTSVFGINGLHFSGSISNFKSNSAIVVTDCEFSRNVVTPPATPIPNVIVSNVGLALLFIDGARIENCTASSNLLNRSTPLSTDFSAGFFSSGFPLSPVNLSNTGIVFDNCDATNNTTNSGLIGGFISSADQPAGVVSGTVYQNCTANSNTTTDPNAAVYGAGFIMQPNVLFAGSASIEKVLIENCIAIRNGQSGASTGTKSAGFSIQGPTELSTVIINCISQSNQGYGYVLQNTTNNIVQDCNGYYNTLSGFADITNPSSATFIGNVAIKNGVPNYSVLYPTPLQVTAGTPNALPAPDPLVSSKVQNVAIS